MKKKHKKKKYNSEYSPYFKDICKNMSDEKTVIIMKPTSVGATHSIIPLKILEKREDKSELIKVPKGYNDFRQMIAGIQTMNASFECFVAPRNSNNKESKNEKQ